MRSHYPAMLASATALAVATATSPFAAPAQSVGAPLAKQAVLSSLTSKLDSKKSKVGDPVAAKTLNSLPLNDGTTLPAGSKITGKVTQVQPKSSGGATLAITFDQMEKKGGTPVPVHGTIVAVAPLPDNASGGTAANNMPLRGTAAQNAAVTGMPVGANGAEASIPPGSSIKGVILSPAPAADGSSVLQSAEKDFKLEGGTRMEIGLTAPQ